MNKIEFIIIGVLYLMLMAPVYGHNEYYSPNGGVTNNVGEAIKWQSYQNIPLWLIFTEANIPTELIASWVPDEFREAFSQWQSVQSGCLSFTENDPDPNTSNDRIEVDFSRDPAHFNDPVYELAITTHPISEIDGTKYFVVSNSLGVTRIRFNNTTNFWFTWTLTNMQGFQNFRHAALHELGHIIGLHHCTASGYPVMTEAFDIYNLFHPRMYLTTDDETGVQGLCNYITGIEDYVWIEKYIEVLNVNQFYYMPAQAHFIDEWPYGDYITEWGNWQITASSSCGDITVYDMPYGSITVSTLPNGYYWNRDENGNVIATLSISGIDNDGVTHWASTPIKIGNVPNTFITSGTLASDTYWCGEVNVTGNITVPTGKTLYVIPGAIIKFPSNTSLIVQGKLDARMCTFTSQSGTSQGSWGSISISGTEAASSELDAVTISYGTRVEAINTSNILIHGCYILNTYDGIRFSGSTGSILNNTITTNSVGHGIIVENSSNVTCNQNEVTKTSNPRSGVGILFRSGSNGTVWQNDINGWDWGVGAIWGSSPQFLLQAQTRNNRITNCRIGVEAYQSSWPVIGAPVSGFGFNSIYNNSYKNVYFTSGGTIWASSTYWASPPTAAMFYLDAGCSINTQYWLASDPWIGYRPENFEEKKGTAIEQENLFFEGIKLRFKKKFREAKDFFISYITNHPEEQAAYVELFNCYNNETGNDLIRFFKSLPVSASKEHKLLLSNLYLNGGMIQEAKNNNSEIIQSNPNTSLETAAKIINIYIALYNDNDFIAACEIFKDVMLYPGLSTPLELQLVQNSIESYASQNGLIVPEIFLSKSNNINLTLPNDYFLFINYPNPFNPSTLINYSIKEAGLVKIEVFDILGSEVATLVNETKEAGNFAVEFNAANLPSGVYIYTLQVNGFTSSKKMLLMK